MRRVEYALPYAFVMPLVRAVVRPRSHVQVTWRPATGRPEVSRASAVTRIVWPTFGVASLTTVLKPARPMSSFGLGMNHRLRSMVAPFTIATTGTFWRRSIRNLPTAIVRSASPALLVQVRYCFLVPSGSGHEIWISAPPMPFPAASSTRA